MEEGFEFILGKSWYTGSIPSSATLSKRKHPNAVKRDHVGNKQTQEHYPATWYTILQAASRSPVNTTAVPLWHPDAVSAVMWLVYCDVGTVVVKAFIFGGFCPFLKVSLLLLHVIVLFFLYFFYCCSSSLRGALASTALICAGKYDVRGLRAALCWDAAGCNSAATRRRKSQLLCTRLMDPYLHPVYNYQWIIFRHLCNCNARGSLYSATRGIYETCFIFICASAMFCRDNKDGRGYRMSGDERMNSLSSICYSPIRPSLLRLAAPEIWYCWRVGEQNWDIGAEYTVFCVTEVHLRWLEC